MFKNRLTFALAAATFVAAGLLNSRPTPAQNSSPPPMRGSEALRGQITVDGSSTVYPITEAVASEFRKLFPNVKTTVGISGTGGGFKRFVVGETDISGASRPIKGSEVEQAMKNNVAFIELPVANDALSIVVNPQNDWVTQLTVEQIRRIYTEKDTAKTWADLDPSWPKEAIKVYSPGTDSGTFDYFKEVMGEDAALRADMSTSEDDNVLVTGVAGDRYAIGYFGASYYQNNKEKLKAVPIVNPTDNKAYEATDENVVGGTYVPFSRPLFIYVNAKSLSRPEMKAFVDFYLQQAPEMAKRVDYTPLSEEIYERARMFHKQRMTGSTYVTADGKKRDGRLPEIYKEENLPKSAK